MSAVAESVSQSIADKVLARAKTRRRPPTYWDFAKTLVLPAGKLAGTKYRPDSDPCQQYLIQQMDSGEWERIYVCAPPQYGGKTQVAVQLPILRNAIGLRLPVGYGLPTLDDLNKAWVEKVHPALKKSGYQDYLPQRGPGSRGGRGAVLQFVEPATQEALGRIVFMAGGAYGSTVAAAIIDEIDQFRNASGAPLWSDIEDIFNRANAYGRKALRIGVGTIEYDTESIILALIFEQATGTVPWLPCPQCGRFQLLDFDAQVIYDPTDEERVRETARISCKHCPAKWDEDLRQQSLRAMKFCHSGQTVDASGAIIGDRPRTTSLGLWWSALESSLADLREVCVDHYRASIPEKRKDYSLMRKFTRYRKCKLYIEPTASDKLDNKAIAKNSDLSGHNKREVPAWVQSIVIGQDVQGDRHYWLALGCGPDDRWCIIDWGYELLVAKDDADPLRTGTPQDRRRVHALIESIGVEGWRYANSENRLSATAYGCDVGYLTTEIAQYIEGRSDWFAMRGVGKDNIALGKSEELPIELSTWLTIHTPPGWPVRCFRVNGHAVRTDAHAALLRTPGNPGSGELPRAVKSNDYLALHLSGEIWEDGTPGKAGHWRELRVRHDLLDCLLYALALGRWLMWHQKQEAAFDAGNTHTGEDAYVGGEDFEV